MLVYPENFFWGAATSAFQVEGDNAFSDWWEWERRIGLKDISGKACDHYNRYSQDFTLAKLLHHNCHRLSIEWSRIEPEENQFSDTEIKHYTDVICSLKELGIEPVVTLHHFTNPLWFSKKGGWCNEKANIYFLRFVKKVTESLSERVKYWVTINEPMVYVYHSYILGAWPPQEKSFSKAENVTRNLLLAHLYAYKYIHDLYKKRNLAPPFVSVAKNIQHFFPCTNSLRNKFALYLRNRLFNLDFIEKALRNNSLDFLGINYYTRSLIETRGWTLHNLLLDTCKENHSQFKRNSLGWEIFPDGLYSSLMALKKFNLPVFILENGICTEDDDQRWSFIYEHLVQMHRAIAAGVKMLGYIYWSLMDNYEWDKGFSHRFGLIGINYGNYERTIRESAKKFSQVCLTNTLMPWNS